MLIQIQFWKFNLYHICTSIWFIPLRKRTRKKKRYKFGTKFVPKQICTFCKAPIKREREEKILTSLWNMKTLQGFLSHEFLLFEDNHLAIMVKLTWDQVLFHKDLMRISYLLEYWYRPFTPTSHNFHNEEIRRRRKTCQKAQIYWAIKSSLRRGQFEVEFLGTSSQVTSDFFESLQPCNIHDGKASHNHQQR